MERKAKIANLAYLSPEQRAKEAESLGFTIEKQDADRVLLADPQGNAVVALRGTQFKHKNMLRDVATDVAILFGKGERTPRYKASERFLEEAKASGKYNKIETVGHSLGAHQALHLGKTYGVETHAFNPAFSLPDVARSVVDRVVVRKKLPHINIYTTGTDPISIASMASLTHNVKRHKAKKGHVSSHALEQFWT